MLIINKAAYKEPQLEHFDMNKKTLNSLNILKLWEKLKSAA